MSVRSKELLERGGSLAYSAGRFTPQKPVDVSDLKQASTRRSSRAVPVGGYTKRVLDLGVVVCALALALPLMAVIVITLYFNGGSPIFSHERVGFGGRRFRCYKFRTMVPDADRMLADLLAEHPDLKERWKTHRKLPDDPRVTSLGRFLRKTSLDELPQLFDVLRGDMSCVGPRPVTEEELENYGPFIHQYLAVRPGLTGLWQVSGRNQIDFLERVRLDVTYIENWSLRSDLIVLARTPLAVLRFKSVY